MDLIREIMNDVEDLRTIPPQEKFVCLFSGGKDCGLAIELALWQGAKLYELIHCMNRDTNETAWHRQSQLLALHQASCMEMPVNITYSGSYQNRTEFVKVLKQYADIGIKYAVCGDLRYGDQAILEMILCLKAGLIPKMPLWERDYDEIMEMQQYFEIESVITYIEDANQIEIDWLGKKFTKEVYEAFKYKNFDPLGEDGEFHTTLVSSKSFKKPMNLEFGIVQYTNEGVKIPLMLDDNE